jgi:hypothetical protein
MNRRLTEQCIRTTCRQLLKREGGVSGRELRRELRERFGAVGKAARVFRIWREESLRKAASEHVPSSMEELQARVLAAESKAADNQARAELAEFREQAHQDHWAAKIDRLRQESRGAHSYLAEIRTLQEQVLKLSHELQNARAVRAADCSATEPQGIGDGDFTR